MKANNISIDPSLWKQISKYIKDKGMSVNEFAEQLLSIFLSPRLERGRPSFSTARLDFFWENGLIDFNAGLLGSNPTRVIGKIMEYLYDLGKYGASSSKMCERLEEEEVTCRRNIAFALGADIDEILFESNTTKSLRLAYDIIRSLRKLPSTDELLTTDVEHNSIKRLFRIESRLRTKEVPLLSLFNKGCDKDQIVERFSSAIDRHTRLLLISHIPYIGGKLPVDEIISIAKEHDHDILCIIDGAHTLGHLYVDVKKMNCDFYGVGIHKFSLGVPAFGSLYADIKYLEELSSNGERFPIFDTYGVSKKFRTDEELGTINGVAIVAFNEAFNLIYNHYSIEKIQQRIVSLTKYFLECVCKNKKISMISPSTSDLISGVVSVAIRSIHTHDEYKKLTEFLEEKHRIICKALKRPPCMRICLHYFNSENDINRFFEVLNSIT